MRVKGILLVNTVPSQYFSKYALREILLMQNFLTTGSTLSRLSNGHFSFSGPRELTSRMNQICPILLPYIEFSVLWQVV